MKLLESLASSKYSPTAADLKMDLEKVEKQSHELTPGLRFVTASASLGLKSPLLFLAVILFVVPPVDLIVDGFYKEIRKLKSLAAYTANPEQYSEPWKLVPDEERAQWIAPAKRSEIESAIEVQNDRLKVALGNVGSIERTILASIPMIALDNPPIYGSRPESPDNNEQANNVAASNDNETTKFKVTAGPMSVVEVNFGNEVMDADLMKAILGSVERSKALPSSDDDFPFFAFRRSAF